MAAFPPADFAGKAAAGTGTLEVVDRARIDSGTVNRWALVITQ